MKTSIHIIVSALFIFTMPFVMAEDDREYSDRRLNERFAKEWENWGGGLWCDNERTKNEIKRLHKEIADLRELCSRKFNEEIPTPPPIGDEDNDWSYGLILTIVIGSLIFLALGFIFWPRKVITPSKVLDSSSSLKCPRCGQERAPNDTVCRNPKCNTKF